MSDTKLRVGISVGDINGIGLEVIIKTFMDNRMFDYCTPIIYGSKQVCGDYRKNLGIQDFSFNYIPDASNANPKKANVVEVWKEEVELNIGKSTAQGGIYALKSLEAATRDLASSKLDVLVTAPINKKNIQSEGFNFPGHTEYLADYANVDNPLMIMTYEDLRVATITGHIPLKSVAQTLSMELIIDKIEVFHKSLKTDFLIERPLIALLGLNPHSGDEGTIGTEEQDVIIPAIKKVSEKGIMAFGPYPADGFFASSSFQKFDGILSMYHDQGLTPFKTLTFDQGVNYTAGLPIVRTSPDHGTAYDIAGKGVASESSFRNAIFEAIRIFQNRKDEKKLLENALEVKPSK
ncbi:MAG: 4-hydroxythreonine-4-phosphate dehydrogenase PdxA [Flavobacteriales bacterium]|nr:4-hydroxythreonine-4-phosphate dehydrogenase PdxA [Flavobacteriales bacterium]